MKIIAEQRYVRKDDGRYILQCRHFDNVGVDASGALSFSQATLSEWYDVPLYLDDWEDEVTDND